MRYCILLLPAHGHAPYLLGSRVARDCDCDIVIPDYYGRNQREILISEFPDYLNRIFMSVELGKILKPALRDALGPVSLDTYVETLNINLGIIDKKLIELLHKGIKVESLEGTKRIITDFTATLNCGLPVFSHLVPTFFIFTGKMSDIYRFSDYQNDSTTLLTNLWLKMEDTFQKIFIPKMNALSYLDYDVTDIHFTPPLTKPYPFDTSPLLDKSILVVPSGTRLNLDNLISITRSSSIPCVTLSNAPAELQFPRFPSNVWGNPNIVGVIARAGWGTIWQCLLNHKPIGTISVKSNEDPEIAHNIKTIEWSGIGVLLKDSVDPLINYFDLYLNNIDYFLTNSLKEFGTNDGISYISNTIKVELQSLLLRSKNSITC